MGLRCVRLFRRNHRVLLPPAASEAASASNSSTADAAPRASAPKTVADSKPGAQLVSVKLNDALPFRIVLTEDVAANAPEGQVVSFRVAEGFQVGDTTVIAKGATVTGEVMSGAGRKKFLGIGASGKLNFRLLFAESVDNEKVRVRATTVLKGDSAPIRPFDTGKGPKSKEIAAAQGTEYIAYIDGEQTIAVHKQSY